MTIIVFDVGNVVVKADHNITYTILQGYGVPKDKAKTFFDNEEYGEFSRGNIGGKSFYSALIKKYLQTPLTFEQVVTAHNKHLCGIDEHVVQIVARLPSQNLVFLTDTNEWQTERERELIDLRKYSRTIYRSHEIGMLKTDEACFPYLINQLKVKPSEILLIDDGLEKIVKAQASGLQTIQFLNSEQLLRDLKAKNLL